MSDAYRKEFKMLRYYHGPDELELEKYLNSGFKIVSHTVLMPDPITENEHHYFILIRKHRGSYLPLIK